MINYLKKFGVSVWNGIYSIAEGMSTLNIYGSPKKFSLPSKDEETKQDIEAMRSGWESVGKDIRGAIGDFKLKNNLDSKL